MKKLLFVIPEYSHGGTNKSLENLLSLIDKTKYDISVYCLYEDGGGYYKKVFAPYILKKSRIYYWAHDNIVTRKVMGLYNKQTKKNNFEWLYKREVRYLQRKYGFNVVVAYQEGTATKFVSYFKDDTKRIAWIHCDYGAWANGKRRKRDEVSYSNINNIICVSESARKSFIALFPEWERKTHAIYNLVRVNDNLNPNLNGNSLTPALSLEGEGSRNKNDFVIVSVGRLDIVKQFEKIPAIANELSKSVKRPFLWYIIGSGNRETLIREEIAKYKVQDVVILLGAKDNPYPYMRQADLVVCTSSSESFSYVLAEAKILHTPVLSNDFPVAYEVVDDSCGWIVNIKDMPQLLTRIINNVDGEYDKKKASIMNYEYSNQELLQKIEKLFGSSAI